MPSPPSGVETRVIEFAESTRTAEEAAAAIGTQVAQIVKSLVFMAGDVPVLALVSGTNRRRYRPPARMDGCAAPPRQRR